MDLPALYTLERLLTFTDANEVPDTALQIYNNLVYHNLENIITSRINEDYFYNEWTGDIVLNQQEYSIPVADLLENDGGCKKILGVSIKYKTTDTEFTKLSETRITNLGFDKSYIQELDYPEYYIADNSYFLLQKPSESIVGGLKVYGTSNLLDLATGGAESTIKLPINQHELIALGTVPYIFQSLGKFEEANNARAIFLKRVEDMIIELGDRNSAPNTIKLPNLNIYA